MRTDILSASLLLVVPLAAGCARARAETGDTAAAFPSAVLGVAGNCPADAGPMHPASTGPRENRNGDAYICTRHVRSIASDTLVDNDAASADSVQPEMYVGM